MNVHSCRKGQKRRLLLFFAFFVFTPVTNSFYCHRKPQQQRGSRLTGKDRSLKTFLMHLSWLQQKVSLFQPVSMSCISHFLNGNLPSKFYHPSTKLAVNAIWKICKEESIFSALPNGYLPKGAFRIVIYYSSYGRSRYNTRIL